MVVGSRFELRETRSHDDTIACPSLPLARKCPTVAHSHAPQARSFARDLSLFSKGCSERISPESALAKSPLARAYTPSRARVLAGTIRRRPFRRADPSLRARSNRHREEVMERVGRGARGGMHECARAWLLGCGRCALAEGREGGGVGCAQLRSGRQGTARGPKGVGLRGGRGLGAGQLGGRGEEDEGRAGTYELGREMGLQIWSRKGGRVQVGRGRRQAGGRAARARGREVQAGGGATGTEVVSTAARAPPQGEDGACLHEHTAAGTGAGVGACWCC